MAKMTEEMANEELKKGYDKANELLQDEDKLEHFLQQLEEKLKVIPAVGDKLAMIPIFVSLLKSYIGGEYKDIPLGSVLAIVSALLYFVSAGDLIPDIIPVAGYADDALVAATCFKLVESDIKDYQRWRKENKKN